MSGENTDNGVFETPESRRSAIKKVGIGAAALWAVPTVLTRTAASAATSAQTNLALAGFASQSTPGQYGGVPQRGNDGNTDCNFFNGSVFHTDPEVNGWWEVNLGNTYALTSITVWNRCDCCEDRARDLSVSVDGNTIGTIPGTGSAWSTASMNLGVSGKIVRVTNNPGVSVPFHLAEVQVFGS